MKDDLTEIVEEIVDDMDPIRIDRVCDLHELRLEDLIAKIADELKARL